MSGLVASLVSVRVRADGVSVYTTRLKNNDTAARQYSESTNYGNGEASNANLLGPGAEETLRVLVDEGEHVVYEVRGQAGGLLLRLDTGGVEVL